MCRRDARGAPETPLIAPFGFTGELQQGRDVWLRARWYGAGRGSFGTRDPYVGDAQTPYSMMPYQYAYAAPTVWTDPTGRSVNLPVGNIPPTYKHPRSPLDEAQDNCSTYAKSPSPPLQRDAGFETLTPKNYPPKLSYSTITEIHKTRHLVDGGGRHLFVDMQTDVLYRIDQFDQPQRYYQVARIGIGCGTARCIIKYVYEDEPLFRELLANVRIANDKSLPLDAYDGLPIVLGCMFFAAVAEAPLPACVAGGLIPGVPLSATASGLRASTNRSDALMKAALIFEQIVDRGQPKEVYGPPQPNGDY